MTARSPRRSAATWHLDCTRSRGFAVTPDTTSRDLLVEGGVRIAPHLQLFADVGQFHDLQPSDVQPALDAAAAQLSGAGLNTAAVGRVPAWYSLGGVRYEAAPVRGVIPYALGGMGFAHLTPTAQFTCTSGTLLDGTTPALGTDITSQLIASGDFTPPAASTALMYSVGGGVQIPVAGRWTADVGYRFSRVAADIPVHAQGATFGFGYRF